MNVDSLKFSNCIFVDETQWMRFRDNSGLIIAGENGVVRVKYKRVLIDEDEEIYYLSRIEGEIAKVVWREDELESLENDLEEVGLEEKEIIVIEDDDDDDDDVYEFFKYE